QLKGALDGIETVRMIQREHTIPVIYLTANADDAYFAKAKDTHPYAFISNPFKKLNLQRAIELTITHMQSHKLETSLSCMQSQSRCVLSDCIFVRHQEKMVKVIIKDILYIEAERNYRRIHTNEKQFLLVTTLKDMDEKLPKKHFIRVHRS